VRSISRYKPQNRDKTNHNYRYKRNISPLIHLYPFSREADIYLHRQLQIHREDGSDA